VQCSNRNICAYKCSGPHLTVLRGLQFLASVASRTTTITVAGQDDLPGVTALSNMMGNISHDDTGEAGHGLKVSERIAVGADGERNFE